MATTNFNCECEGGIGNLGVPSCFKNPALGYKDIFVQTYKSDGTRNAIPKSALVNGVISASTLNGYLINTDPTQRWYLTPGKLEEIESTRTDRTVQEGQTGTMKILRSGQLSRSYELWDVPYNWSASLNKAGCNEISVYRVDESGALSGQVSEDGAFLYPLPIQKGSLNAESFEPTASKDGYTSVTYQISRNFIEGLLITLPASALGADLRNALSLIEVDLTQGTGTNTNTILYVDAKSVRGGDFVSPYPFKGATDDADWEVKVNNTAETAITVSSVEEIADGEYKITIAADAATSVNVYMVKERTNVSDLGFVADRVTLTKP